MSKKLITRADDFGSARAANEAILEAVRKDCIIKNVSCMAAAPYIEEGAGELKKYTNVCIGLHAVLNSEWDGIQWSPLSKGAKNAGLVDERGSFFRTQTALAQANPDIEGILKEYDAQLEKLVQLGLRVEYVDSHMVPELFVPGLFEALKDWSGKKGLIDTTNYYCFLEGEPLVLCEDKEQNLQKVEAWCQNLRDGEQYSYILHPAKPEEEMLLFYNETLPAGVVQQERAGEYRIVTADDWKEWARIYDLQFLKYSEALKRPDGMEQLKSLIQ